MTCSALTAVCLFVLAAAFASEINAEDERSEPSPDPFRLHRFRAGDRGMEEE
jgi:hypothetical protein